MEFVSKPNVKAARSFCSGHRQKLMQDTQCGCFYCIRRFHPSEIQAWIDENGGGTALCPYCGIDAVIGSYAGYPLTDEFLQQMYDFWFN